SVDVLGILGPRTVGDSWLRADRIPPLGDRSFQIHPRLIARQRRHALSRARQFRQHFVGFELEAGLVLLRTTDVEGAAALVTPPDVVKDFAHPALGVAERDPLLNQVNDGAKRPPTAHLRARHRLRREQRTESGKLLAREPALPVLPAPQWVVLQAVEPL